MLRPLLSLGRARACVVTYTRPMCTTGSTVSRWLFGHETTTTPSTPTKRTTPQNRVHGVTDKYLQHGGKLTGAVKAASPADVGIGDIPVPDLPPGTWDDFWGKGGGGRAEGGSGDVSSSSASSSGRSTSLRRVVSRSSAKFRSARILRSAGQVRYN